MVVGGRGDKGGVVMVMLSMVIIGQVKADQMVSVTNMWDRWDRVRRCLILSLVTSG